MPPGTFPCTLTRSEALSPRPDHMKRLFNLATSETRVFRGYSGGHNDTYVAGGAQYYRDIADFLLSCETPDNVK